MAAIYCYGVKMHITAAALDLIKSSEGCKLHAYRDPTGIATIGYGHTGPEVQMGMTITQDEAESLFVQDISMFSAGVTRVIKNATTTGEQFGAFVSLAYNIGLGNFGVSTALRRHCNQDYQNAADAILRWDKAGGKMLPRLVKRRAKERELYLSNIPSG